jgi:hypothetical protein
MEHHRGAHNSTGGTMLPVDNITEPELRSAFRRCGLWRHGWTFKRAKETPGIFKGLCIMAHAMHQQMQTQIGKPAPVQRTLI